MSNRESGLKFEKHLCQLLSEHGFWVHNLTQNAQGQPFDILVAKNGKAYPIDAKECKTNSFSLSRVEDNQYWAMRIWKDCNNLEGWFALKMRDGEIFLLPLSTLEKWREKKTTLSYADIEVSGVSLKEWVELCG